MIFPRLSGPVLLMILLAASLGSGASAPETDRIPSGAFLQSTAPGIRLAPKDSYAHPASWTPEPPDPLSVPRMLRTLRDGTIMLASFPECFYFDAGGNQIAEKKLEMPDRETIESVSEPRVRSNVGTDGRGFLDVIELFRNPDSLYAVTANADGRVWALFRDNWYIFGLLCEWEPSGDLVRIIDTTTIPLTGRPNPNEWGYGVSHTMTCDGDTLLIYGERGDFVILKDGEIVSYKAVEGWGGPSDWVVLLDGVIYHISPPWRMTRTDFEDKLDDSWTLLEIREGGGFFEGHQIAIGDQGKYGPWGIGLLTDGRRIELWREEKEEYDSEKMEVRHIVSSAELVSFASDGSELSRTPYQSVANSENNPLFPFDSSVFYCVETPEGFLFLNRLMSGEPAKGEIFDSSLNHIGTVQFVPSPAPPDTGDTIDLVTAESGTPRVGARADMSLVGRDFRSVPQGFMCVDNTGRLVLTLSDDLEILDIVDIGFLLDQGIIAQADACRVDSSGSCYVLDCAAQLIVCIDRKDDIVRQYRDLTVTESVPSDPIGYAVAKSGPDGFAVDGKDNLWVWGPRCISIFGPDGRLAKVFRTRPVEAEAPSDSTEIPGIEPTQIDAIRFSDVIVPDDPGSDYFFVADDALGWILVLDRDGTELGRIDWYPLEGKERPESDSGGLDEGFLLNTGVLSREWTRFFAGPDGYFYYFSPHNPDDSESARLLAFDALGGEIARIDVYDLPGGLWSFSEIPVWPPPGLQLNRAWIDPHNRLVIYNARGQEAMVYPLRVDDDLKQYDFVMQDFAGQRRQQLPYRSLPLAARIAATGAPASYL